MLLPNLYVESYSTITSVCAVGHLTTLRFEGLPRTIQGMTQHSYMYSLLSQSMCAPPVLYMKVNSHIGQGGTKGQSLVPIANVLGCFVKGQLCLEPNNVSNPAQTSRPQAILPAAQHIAVCFMALGYGLPPCDKIAWFTDLQYSQSVCSQARLTCLSILLKGLVLCHDHADQPHGAARLPHVHPMARRLLLQQHAKNQHTGHIHCVHVHNALQRILGV